MHFVSALLPFCAPDPQHLSRFLEGEAFSVSPCLSSLIHGRACLYLRACIRAGECTHLYMTNRRWNIVFAFLGAASPLHGEPTTIHTAKSDGGRGGGRITVNVPLSTGAGGSDAIDSETRNSGSVYHSSPPIRQISNVPMS